MQLYTTFGTDAKFDQQELLRIYPVHLDVQVNPKISMEYAHGHKEKAKQQNEWNQLI